MALPQPKPKLSYADYLAYEAVAEERHEFHHGELFAMSGGSPAHAALIQNVSVLLGNALRGHRCRPTSSAQRIRITPDVAVYPDALVVCPPFQRASDDPDAFTNPVVVVEVLSPTTQAYDRGGKFELYRSVPSLRHVLLVRQDAWRVEHYRRMDDGSWILRDLGPGDVIDLDAVEARVAIDDLYEGIEAFDGPARDASPPAQPVTRG